ncbi:Transmembrane protein 120 [Nymphon striatum]|nr:Transmembrane protein 120 [Nymphon striatum]
MAVFMVLLARSSSCEKDCLQKLELEEKVTGRLSAIDTMKETLPRSNGLYLKIILGNVNVSLLNKQEKLKYKDEYERFKLIVTSIIFFLSFINIFIKYRFMNSSLLFLLVWYYCTLTIRESILKVNGSRIKGWWRTHHFIATVLSGVLLIWPDGITFDEFNRQFMIYNCYTSFVQFLQFNYQQGVLYRLKCLGERHNMDITIEGFHSWMWRGLSFLLPFLYVAYGFQLYNAYVLWNLSFHLYCVEWQVPVLAAIFLMLFIGNSLTTSLVIHQKFKEIYYDNEDSNTDTKTEKVN